jgi:hypothetical protein
VAYNCYAPGVFATSAAVPIGAYNVPITDGSGSLLGCARDGGYGCPNDFPFPYSTVISASGDYSLNRCFASGVITACQAPAVAPPATVLTYSTPAYTQGV